MLFGLMRPNLRLFNYPTKCYVQYKPSVIHQQKHTITTTKQHGGDSIMLWGRLTATGPGRLVNVVGYMTVNSWWEMRARKLQLAS